MYGPRWYRSVRPGLIQMYAIPYILSSIDYIYGYIYGGIDPAVANYLSGDISNLLRWHGKNEKLDLSCITFNIFSGR